MDSQWIRKALYSNRGDEALVGMMATLAGMENVRIDVKVDSTEGNGGVQHDFSLTQIGSQFGIQTEVFGGNC